MYNELVWHRQGEVVFTPLSGHDNWTHRLPLVVIAENKKKREFVWQKVYGAK